MGVINRLIRKRDFWFMGILFSVVAVLNYAVLPNLFPGLVDDHDWYHFFSAIRGVMFLVVVMIASWEGGFIGGMVCGSIVGIAEWFKFANSSNTLFSLEQLTMYAVFAPAGVVMSWLIGSRKKISEELRSIDIDLEVAQRLTRIGSWKWNIATNKVTWSLGLCEILGYDINLPAPPFIEMERFYTPESWKRLNELVTRAISTGEPYEVELEEIRTDGVKITTLTRSEVKYDANGKIEDLHGTVQDITEQKRAEATLKESEVRYKTLAETAAEGILAADMETRKFIYANPAICKLLGYSQEELLNMSVIDIHPKDSLEQVLADFDSLARSERDNVVVPCLKKDGTILSVNIVAAANTIDGRLCNIGFFTDVTEREQSQKQADTLIKSVIRKAKEWQDTFDSVSDFVMLISPEHEFIRVNKATAEALGKKPEEIIGKKCYELVHGLNSPILGCPCKETLATKKSCNNEIIDHGRNYIATAAPMFDENGEIAALAHTVKDITESKKLQEQLMVQDRLASIGQLVSGVAHELNNPMTSVVGFSDLLLQRDLPADIKADLEIINSEAKRTAKIVQNLLTFSRQTNEAKVLTNIRESIDRVLALRHHEQAVNNIVVNKVYPGEIYPVIASPSQLQQVFFNLIVNAEQAILEAHHKGNITITLGKVGNMVRVTVTDNGPGISPENMKKLFTPFFTTKGVGKGTGLGLSIIHGIISEHGGKISAESELGKGATFIVELPVSKPPGTT